MLNEEEGRILGILNGIWHLTRVWSSLEFPLMHFVNDCLLPKERIEDQIAFCKMFQSTFVERYAARMGVNDLPIPSECAAKVSFTLPERYANHLAGDLSDFGTLLFLFDAHEEKQVSSLDIYAARNKDGSVITLPILSLNGITIPQQSDALQYYGNGQQLIVDGPGVVTDIHLPGDHEIEVWHLSPKPEIIRTNGPGEQMRWYIHVLAVLSRIGPSIASYDIGYMSPILRSYTAFASDLMTTAPDVSIGASDDCNAYTVQILREAISQQDGEHGKFAYMTSDKCNAFRKAISPWKQYLPIPDERGDLRARPDLMIASKTGDGFSWSNDSKKCSPAYYSVQSPDEEVMDIHCQRQDTFAFSLLNLAKNLLVEKIDSPRFCHIEDCVKTATDSIIQRAIFERAFVSYFATEIMVAQI